MKTNLDEYGATNMGSSIGTVLNESTRLVGLVSWVAFVIGWRLAFHVLLSSFLRSTKIFKFKFDLSIRDLNENYLRVT